MNGAYKGVIFDFNGTLFFDNDKHILAWGEISKMLRGMILPVKQKSINLYREW